MLCPLCGEAHEGDDCSVVQAALYDVFVTQPPDQDPERCFQRNVHDRTREDVAAAAATHEPLPPTLRTVDCAAIAGSAAAAASPPLPGAAAAANGGSAAAAAAAPDAKRKVADGDGGAVDDGGAPKRARDGPAAGGDSGSEMDTGEPQRAAGARGGDRGAPRSRWADDDDDDDDDEEDEEARSAPRSSSRWERGARQVRSKQQEPEAQGTPATIGAPHPPAPLCWCAAPMSRLHALQKAELQNCVVSGIRTTARSWRFWSRTESCAYHGSMRLRAVPAKGHAVHNRCSGGCAPVVADTCPPPVYSFARSPGGRWRARGGDRVAEPGLWCRRPPPGDPRARQTQGAQVRAVAGPGAGRGRELPHRPRAAAGDGSRARGPRAGRGRGAGGGAGGAQHAVVCGRCACGAPRRAAAT